MSHGAVSGLVVFHSSTACPGLSVPDLHSWEWASVILWEVGGRDSPVSLLPLETKGGIGETQYVHLVPSESFLKGQQERPQHKPKCPVSPAAVSATPTCGKGLGLLRPDLPLPTTASEASWGPSSEGITWTESCKTKEK